MNTYPSNLQELEIQRRQLEKLWQPTSAPKIRQTPSHWLRAAGQWLLQALTEGDQLKVWESQTKQGNRWCIYDPIGDAHHQFESEEAMRVWLEQRYNH